MKKFDFYSAFLSPLFAGWFILAALIVYYVLSYAFSLNFGFFDIENVGITESLTYIFYGFAGGILLCCREDFQAEEKPVFFATVFLFICAILREMGIQHWLTSHDTVVTKTRFFTNPTNPMYEKIIAGFLMLLVLVVLSFFICKCFKKFIRGFLKKQPLPWTFIFLLILGVTTQIADRFPANYFKANGVELSEHLTFVLKIFEEGGESLLPLLFAIAILQYHYSLKNREIGKKIQTH